MMGCENLLRGFQDIPDDEASHPKYICSDSLLDKHINKGNFRKG